MRVALFEKWRCSTISTLFSLFLVMCYFWQKHAYTTFALLYAGQWIPTVRNGLPFIVYRRYNWSNHILCHSWAYSSTRIQSVCSSSDKVFKQMLVFHMTSIWYTTSPRITFNLLCATLIVLDYLRLYLDFISFLFEWNENCSEKKCS